MRNVCLGSTSKHKGLSGKTSDPRFTPHLKEPICRRSSAAVVHSAQGAAEFVASTSQGVDVAGPAADLIVKAAGHMVQGALLGQAAMGSILSSFVNDTLHTQGSPSNWQETFLSTTGGLDALVHAAQSMAETASPIAASLSSSLPDIANITSASGLGSSVHPSSLPLDALAMWASDRLTVVQSIDPASYASLTASLDTLVHSMKGALEQHSDVAAYPHWTNALVLGVHQLVTTLHAPGTGGVTVEAMLVAQEAMQATLATAAAEASGMARAAGVLSSGAAAGEMPAGLMGLLQFVLALIAMLVASVPKGPVKSEDVADLLSDPAGLPLRYDPPALEQYFSRHPVIVLQRNSAVISKLVTFFVTVIADWRLGQWDAKMQERAIWSRQIIQELGPAYIKIAQAVSTRVDIMPEFYINEFAILQDNVKPFSTVEARQVLENGLGRPVDEVFDWLSEEPIAAASLGQVYRGMLRPEWGGREVAVKVQRPAALESVSLDIFIMSRAAKLFSQIPGMSDKWASALDDWAERFFMEMDYQLEARNTMTFKQHMIGLQGVRVATVYPELTSRKVIVTEWIEGERLGESSSEDVKALCSTLLNCYLIQLLETGLLHADPHPGNLMRTPDGKIVILDFGLMTEVSEDQRIALVEYIAHLTVEDWEAVANDLVKLGFMPDGMPPGAAHQIAPIMEKVMGQLVRGGGLRNGISITGITAELSGVAMNYQLAIPPYFALVIRAFSVIEGIALKVDPDYAIVQECMPYMSRRLLTDNNPRMRSALKQLLYGGGTRLDVERLSKMVSAFSNFTTSVAPEETSSLATGPTFSSAASPKPQSKRRRGRREEGGSLLSGFLLGPGDEGPILNESMKEVLKVIFSKEGSYAQEILVDEAVAAIDAMSREAMGETLRLVAGGATTVAAMRGAEALGPLRAMLMPLPLPLDVLTSMQPALALSKEDKQALSTIRALLDLLIPSPGSAGPNMAGMGARAVQAASEVAPLLPELLPGVQLTLEMFMRQLLRRMALRLAEDLDTAAKVQSDARAARAAATSYQSPVYGGGGGGGAGGFPPQFAGYHPAQGMGFAQQQQQGWMGEQQHSYQQQQYMGFQQGGVPPQYQQYQQQQQYGGMGVGPSQYTPRPPTPRAR